MPACRGLSRTRKQDNAGFKIPGRTALTAHGHYCPLSNSPSMSLEQSKLDTIYKAHQDEGWYLHQPAYCGKVVSTIAGCGPSKGKPSSTSPRQNAGGSMSTPSSINRCLNP